MYRAPTSSGAFSMTFFNLNPRLEGDSYFVADLPLCAVRLMKDANYPWLLLVPRKSDMVELIDLDESDQLQLMREVAKASRALRAVSDCEKLNVGALGNQVSQLHVHVIARFRDDPAWPGPVWGTVPPVAYEPARAEALIERLAEALEEDAA
ncbi:MAG: HIT family protein [Roseibium sp.]